MSAIVLGDESGYLDGENQKMKLAAIESMWHTEAAPASFTVFGFPDQAKHEIRDSVKIPFVLGIIATRSLYTSIPGIDDLVNKNEQRIIQGIPAYRALQTLIKDPNNESAKLTLRKEQSNLGYSLLLKRYTPNVVDATPAQIKQAAWDTVPNVPVIFWSFRIMVACAFFFLGVFALAFYFSCKRTLEKKWFLWLAACSLPLPWVASELGWVVAEYGRQPWAIDGVLPTFLGTSTLATTDLWISLSGFVVFYTLLAVVEIYLMVKYIRLGPEYLAVVE